MSCCDNTIQAQRDADFQAFYLPQGSFSFADVTPTTRIWGASGSAASPALTLGLIQSVNGSAWSHADEDLSLLIKQADLDALPDETLYYDTTLTDLSGIVHPFDGGVLDLYPDGSTGGCNTASSIRVAMDGQQVPVIIQTGGLGVSMSLQLAELNQAVADAQAAEELAEQYRDEAQAATADKAEKDGSNILGADQAAFRTAIGAVSSSALLAATGSTLTGWISSVSGSVYRTVSGKLQEFYSLYDVGASTANSPAANTTAIQAACYSGRTNIRVPIGTFEVNSFALGEGVNLIGEGFGSRLKNMTAANVDFISILNVTNCLIQDLWIDGNRLARTGGFVATQGANVRVINTEIAATPRLNNVRILNTKNTGAGFVGVFLNNAHDVYVVGNHVTGDTDTAIAACVGSSGCVISGNTCTGFSFGISLSSDGNADLATTGYVRNCTVTGNIVNNTKTGGYGIQGDGLDTFTMTGNTINMLGGQYGFRFYNSRGLGIAGAVDVFNGAITGNVVNYISNVAGAAFDVTGIGDFRSVVVTGLSARSPTTLANGVYGISVTGGVSATFSDFSLENMGYGINVNQNNVTGCKVTFREGRVRTARVAVEGSTNTHANKCEMVFEHVEITGGVDANFSIANGINLTLIDTPVVGTNYMSENSRTGMGLPVRGTAAPSLNAEYIGQVFIDTTTPKQYMAKAIGTGASDWLALN